MILIDRHKKHIVILLIISSFKVNIHIKVVHTWKMFFLFFLETYFNGNFCDLKNPILD